MKKLMLSMTVLSASIAAPTLVHADYDNCAYLSVVIANNGNEPCYLTESYLKHGSLGYYDPVPEVIYPNTYSQPFEVRQSIFGPDISLTYQCGQGRQITIESQQNFCLFMGGTITGMAYNNYYMGADYTKSEGSYWGRHGEITWYLHS